MSKYTTLMLAVKDKKELQGIDNNFVLNEILLYFRSNPKEHKDFEKGLLEKSTKYKKIVKDIRSLLRRSYGLFRTKKGAQERAELLSQLTSKNTLDIVPKLLKTNPATKERLPFYEEIYRQIFAITGRVESIADLGCGINPYSIPLMNFKGKYYAYDISQEEVPLFEEFFERIRVQGKAGVANLFMPYSTKVDMVFLFKITDVIDRGKGHKNTELLLTSLRSKYVVVSFPTITMSNKRMRFPRRKWMELLCERLGYTFDVIEVENELFYVIKML